MENPKLYKGIEYVQLEELPQEQQARIKESLNQEFFVKILINGKLYQDCILYKDYSYWFKSVYLVNLNPTPNTLLINRNHAVSVERISQEKG